MQYYFNTTRTNISFEKAIVEVHDALKKQGFGVLTEIDLKATFKKKIDVDFYNYIILGACNPLFAYESLKVEDKIGTMLPCNIIVQEREAGKIEISAVDPAASMSSVANERLKSVATDVRERLKKVILDISEKEIQ